MGDVGETRLRLALMDIEARCESFPVLSKSQMSSVQDRIQFVVGELHSTLQKLHVRDFGGDDPQVLFPGATDTDIDTVADLIGAPVPPSYAAFLRLHNGWDAYNGGAKLLTAGEQSAPWVHERLEELREALEDSGAQAVLENAFPVMLGDEESVFAVLNLSKRDEHGELQVVHWDLDEGEVGTSDSFLDFLEDELETALDDLDDDDLDDE